MVRGRTIDESLPLTRSLTIQREYRARKAAKIKDQEETIAPLSAENAALKAEIADLKGRVRDPSALTHSQLAVVEAATREVESTLRRLYEVQQMAVAADGGAVVRRPHSQRPRASVGPSSRPAPPGTPMRRVDTGSRPPSLHQVPSPSLSAGSDVSLMTYSDTSFTSFTSSLPVVSATGQPQPVPMFDPNCCGGLFDCSALPMSGMRAGPPTHFQTPGRNSDYAPPPPLQNGMMPPMPTPQPETSKLL